MKIRTSEELDCIWGGTVTNYVLSMTQDRFECEISVLDSGRESTYRLQCRDVSHFHFRKERPIEWDYIELTAAMLGYNKDRTKIILEISFWSDTALLSLTCTEVLLE